MENSAEWVKTQWKPGDQVTWYPEWISEGKIYVHG